MSETTSLVFKSDGTCVGLYTELIDLTAIGRLHIKRVTNIEFDDNRQVWRVKNLQGMTLYESPSRQSCLNWEQTYFDGSNHGN